MDDFEKIYLSWRPGQGKRRHIVGVLEHHHDDKFTFDYDKKGIEEAIKEGFSPYTEFADTQKTYNGNVLDVFAQRLMKPERSDVQTFYNFWEIEPQFINDKFYLLGHTQGLLPTDNFEFLAEYKPVTGLHFLTDLARVAERELISNSVMQGDKLRYRLDKNNQYYSYAVKVYKGDIELGFIKKIHSKIFYEVGEKKLNLTVKAIDQNGIIKRIFVKVSV
ncbi:MAG TPA: hypothetical protein VK809_10340 [Bacteroidia bacterium]|jgi:hypothetical protein|nr:hypothetical protein [Bacteroidia bacterium]